MNNLATHARWQLLALALSSLAACRAAPPPIASTGPNDSLGDIAEELLGKVEQRADLARMVVCVHRMEESGASDRDPRVDSVVHYRRWNRRALEEELQGELVFALSDRVHMLEPAWDGGEHLHSATELAEVAANSEATHLLVGEYAQQGDEVLVSVRLVDVATRLIVATSRGAIPLRALSERLRQARSSYGGAHAPAPYEPTHEVVLGGVVVGAVEVVEETSGGPAA